MKNTIRLSGRVCDEKHILAARFGVTERTIRYWEGQHRFPPGIKIGKRRFYDRALVEEWLLKGEAH